MYKKWLSDPLETIFTVVNLSCNRDKILGCEQVRVLLDFLIIFVWEGDVEE